MSQAKNNIQAKMTQLDELIKWFNSDSFELEVALDKFKEAKKLADDIEHDLRELKNTIKVVSERFDQEQE